MTQSERLAATLDGTFVVFMIGMRINSFWKVNKWWPMAMPRMVKELSQQPESGFLHAEAWFGRTTIMVQYWRSLEQLLAYTRNKESEHLPAWRAFNQAVGTSGSVGISHETYVANRKRALNYVLAAAPTVRDPSGWRLGSAPDEPRLEQYIVEALHFM